MYIYSYLLELIFLQTMYNIKELLSIVSPQNYPIVRHSKVHEKGDKLQYNKAIKNIFGVAKLHADNCAQRVH